MNGLEGGELLEIYRLHAELADRVSQRREGANRLYVSLLLALVVFLAAFFRFDFGDLPSTAVLIVVGSTGVALSVSWFVTIRSYRQLNTGKLKALREIEERLAYPFYKREWELLGEGNDRSRYFRLTQAEAVLPWIYLLLFLVVIAMVPFAHVESPASCDIGEIASPADDAMAMEEFGNRRQVREPLIWL